MQALVADLVAEASAYSLLEVVAVVLALAYLVLAIRLSVWCWPCALLSTGIYVYLFVDAKLYMQSALNLFYLCMAVYGWHAWLKGGRDRQGLAVSVLPLRVHVIAIPCLLLLSAAAGLTLTHYTDARYPYADALTAFAAIWATLLIARKVLENWWYWLVIDAISVAIFWRQDLPLTALLFVIYLSLIPLGLLRWRRSWRAQFAQ